MPNTNTALTLINSHYPAFNEIAELNAFIKKEYTAFSMLDDSHLSFLRSHIWNDPNARRVLIESRETPMDLDSPLAKEGVEEALRNFRLPEGWGTLLRDLAQPLIEGISLEILLVDPCLIFLVKMVLFHGLFVKTGRKENDAVITRSDSLEIARDEAYAGSLAVSAQDLLDILKLIPTFPALRSGRARLFKQMLGYIEDILTTPY